MHEIITGNFAPFRWVISPPNSIRVVDWNIDRGLRLQGIIDFLKDMDADVLILQEVDINARRTHRLNIAQEIARKLQMNYAFGREFEELTQGSKASPAYHGQATLSRWSISSPRVIRFRRQSNFWRPRWFLPRVEPFQERLGGRIALVAEINIAGCKLVTYNLHLESRANDELRISQLDEVLSDAAFYDPQCILVMAGDLNLNASKNAAAVSLACAVFRNAVELAPTPTTPSRRLFEAGRPIDWAFVRGPIQTDSWQVHRLIQASDHYPISFYLHQAKSALAYLG
jgi:endonuclease/exonuclease/phosphatase family metal-dependent hydrolase